MVFDGFCKSNTVSHSIPGDPGLNQVHTVTSYTDKYINYLFFYLLTMSFLFTAFPYMEVSLVHRSVYVFMRMYITLFYWAMWPLKGSVVIFYASYKSSPSKVIIGERGLSTETGGKVRQKSG